MQAEVASFVEMERDLLLKYTWMRFVIYLLTMQVNNHFFPQECVWLSLSNRSIDNLADPLSPSF